jgi:hypothetical protein
VTTNIRDHISMVERIYIEPFNWDVFVEHINNSSIL